MTVEKWGCSNPKCKTKTADIVEIMSITSSCANYLPYCITNKKTKTIDQKKHALLQISGEKWRCGDCFNAFLKSNSLSSFYHLMEVPNKNNKTDYKEETNENSESHETNETEETKELNGQLL